MGKKVVAAAKTPPVPIEAFQQQAKEQPADAAAQLRLGWALYGAGRLQEARKVLEDAQRDHPSDLEVVYALGLTLKRAGDPGPARTAFQKLLELIPGVQDRTRSAVLRRIAHGHLHMLENGRWDLEKEIWGRS